MPKVTFRNDGRSIELPSGTSLTLAAQRAGSSLPFGCRAGRCGTCALRVVEGAEDIEEQDFLEADTLRLAGHPDSRRLACQIVLEQGDLVVEW